MQAEQPPLEAGPKGELHSSQHVSMTRCVCGQFTQTVRVKGQALNLVHVEIT